MGNLKRFLIPFCLSILFAGNALANESPDCTLPENKFEPRCIFEFDENDQVHTESGKAERTFAFPPVKTGFVYDVYSQDIEIHLSLEVLYFKSFALDLGVASQRAFVSLTYEFIPVIKIGAGIWAGYNVTEEQPAFGVGVAILDF
jgi:hypothetical protein